MVEEEDLTWDFDTLLQEVKSVYHVPNCLIFPITFYWLGIQVTQEFNAETEKEALKAKARSHIDLDGTPHVLSAPEGALANGNKPGARRRESAVPGGI
jgi:hypothetical protein